MSEKVAERVIYEDCLDITLPCCRGCDGWKCDGNHRLYVTLQLVEYGKGDTRFRVVGQDPEGVREAQAVLGIY